MVSRLASRASGGGAVEEGGSALNARVSVFVHMWRARVFVQCRPHKDRK